MSLPPYNPYASGNQNPTQGQYGLPNTQTERDPRRRSSLFEHGVIPSSSGAPFGIPENSGGRMSSLLSYRSDASRMTRDEEASSKDMHINKAREKARLPGNPMNQHMEHGPSFIGTQRDEFRSSGTGVASYQMASASSSRDTHQAVIESGNNNFSWLANCARPSSDGSVMKSSPALSNFARGDGGQFDTSSDGQSKMQAIPGLGDFEYPASDKSEASTEPKYTSESAVNILQRFGLEKEDLEHLISYPEDQITPANLPFILRKIRLEKDKKATAGLQPTPTVTGPGSYSLSRAAELRIEETSSSVLQPSKVIDYGHTGKYTGGGAGDDTGRRSDKDNRSVSVFMMDTSANRLNLEPLHKKQADVQSSALGSSREQGSSFPSSSYSSAPSSVASPGSNQTKQLLTQPSPTYQNILSSFLFPKKDAAKGGLTSEASKPVPVKQLESDRQAAKAPVSSTSSHGKHPNRPSLVLIKSNDPSGTKDLSKTKSKMSAVNEHTKHQGKQKEQTKQQPMKQQQKTLPSKLAQKQPAREQQSKQQTKQSQKKPVPQTKKVLPQTVGNSAPPAGFTSNQNKSLTFKKQHKDTLTAPMDQPTPLMMFDYSATQPRIYPHTCSLCNKECTNMQGWLSHQNSSIHLESCTLLRKQYPKWDGEIVLQPRAAGKDTKPSTSTSVTKPRRRSRSRSKSLSPSYRTGSAGRKDKCRSRSRSPQSSKYSRRYEIPGSNRSQSPERQTSPQRKNDRQFSPRRTSDRRSPARRSNDSWSPPRRVNSRRSPPRRSTETRSPPRRSTETRSPPRRSTETRSPPRRSTETRSPPRRSTETRSPPRRSTETRSPPRRSTETRSPPRRSTETRSPPRRGEERWSPRADDDRQSPLRRSGNRWPPRRSDNSRSPQRRSQERRTSRESSSPQRKGLNSAESLAKKLMETSAIQSLSHPSDLEAVVKTLAPALLAELAKMTSSSPSTSSSAKRKKLSSTSSSSSTREKGSDMVPSKPKHTPNEVELSHICDIITYKDLGRAVGQFGKTVRVKIHRDTQRALVQYEKVGAAERLKQAGGFTVKGTRIIVVQGKKAATEKQTKKPLKKRATPSAQTTTKGLLPLPGLPPRQIKPVDQKASAKASAKAASGVNKAKVLVTKAKSVSTKKITKKRTALKVIAVKTALAKAPEGKQEEKPVPLKTDATSVTASVKVIEPAKVENTNQTKVAPIEGKVFALQKPGASAVTVTNEKVEGTSALPFESEASATEEQLPPEQSEEESAVLLKPTVEDDLVGDRTVTEPDKDPWNEKTVIVSQAETMTPLLTPQRPLMDKPEETAVKATNEPTRPPNEESSKPKLSQPKLQGSSEARTDAAEVVEKENTRTPPTMVKLHGICSSLSHSEVVSAVECFGKTKSVVLFRARLEAVVIFEKVEDARKLRTVKNLSVNGTEITVVGEKEAVSKEQKTPLLKKPASSAPSLSMPRGVTAATKEKVLVPVAKKVSTQETETLASERDAKKVVVKQNTASDSKSSESQPDAGDSKQTAVEESVVGLTDKSEGAAITAETESITEKLMIPVDKLQVGETVDVRETETKVSAPDLQSNVETSRLKESDRVDIDEPMELEVTEVKAAEPEEVGICMEDPRKSLDETQQNQTSVGQQGKESIAQGPETGTESTNEASVDSTSTEDASKAAAASQPKPTTSQQSSSVATRLTIGEMLEKHLTPRCIYCRPFSNLSSMQIPKGYRQVLISGLPLYHEGFYTEGDICNVLSPFGLRDKNSIYVIPQSRMVIAMMPSLRRMQCLLREAYMNGIYFRGIRLLVEVIASRHFLTPAEFYKFLKKVLKQSTAAEAHRTVLIRNISQSEMKKLREALKEFAPVTNFMPLLNKLFIEFESIPDACAFKCWYDLRFPTPCHNVWLKREVFRLGRLPSEEALKTPDQVSVKSSPSKEETAITSQEPETSKNQPESTPIPDKSETTETKPPTGALSNEAMAKEAVQVSENQPESKPGPDKSETTDKELTTPSNKATEKEAVLVSEKQLQCEPDRSDTTDTKPATEAPSSEATAKEAVQVSENQPDSNPRPDKSETTETEPETGTPSYEATAKDVTEAPENQPESKSGPDKSDITDSRPATEAPSSEATAKEVMQVSENQPDSKTRPDDSETTETKPPTEALSNEITAKEAVQVSKNQPDSKPGPDKSETTDTKPPTGAPSNEATAKDVTEAPENQLESKPGPDESETTDKELTTLSNKATEKEAVQVSEKQPDSKPRPDKSETTDTKPPTEAPSSEATAKEAVQVSENQPDSKPGPDKSETTETEPETETLSNKASENLPESKPKPDKSDATDMKPTAPSNKAAEEEVTEAPENHPVSSDSEEKTQSSENSLKEPAVEDDKTTDRTTCEPHQGTVSAPKVQCVSTSQEPQTEVCKPLQTHGESSQLNQTETKAHGSLGVIDGTRGSKDEAKLDKAEDAGEPMELGELEELEAKKVAAPAASEQKKPAASKGSSSAVIRPTIGEMLGTRLFPHSIYCRPSSYLSPASKLRQLLITRLPRFHEGLYTESDVANVLAPFGFQNTADTLFVIPQSRMAFAIMPLETSVCDIIREAETNGVYFQGNPLLIEAIIIRSQLNAHKFYRFLKKLLKCSVDDEAERTVLITNISQSATKKLREALTEFAPVTNFMPLLNKLFIEFKAVADADQFEGWYRQLSDASHTEVFRLSTPGPVDSCLTPGERFLKKNKIWSLKCGYPTSPKMLISWLEGDCCQTEDDMVNLLTPFGYQQKSHSIYIFPQACLAFVQMQSTRAVTGIIKAFKRKPLVLNGTELSVHGLNGRVSLRPFWLYKTLMQLIDSSLANNRERVIFIRNITASEVKELKEVLKKQDSIMNILPLLNKVFIEFKTSKDADWLGVWYSLLKKPPDHIIQRLKIPNSYTSSLAPKIPKDPFLDNGDVIEGATLPTGKGGIPHGSMSPFWLSLRNSPFVYPTVCPWFIIPEYMTVRDMNGIEKANCHGLMCPTIMLTGLPEGDYKHEDVAWLVWPFFHKRDLHSLFYNVTVLPLQRRAFVFFADWATCCEFLKAHIDNQSSLNGRAISVHVVMQNMYPETSEENMYRSLMKLTNAGVPDPSPLEERLLCVGISEVSLDVITLVIEMVASITTIVNFLPLANRICIEMSDSSSVAQVVEKYNDLSPNSFTEDPSWSRVQYFETLESLRKRLQDSADIKIKLEDDTIVKSNPELDRTSLKSIKVTVGQHRLVEKSLSVSPQRMPEKDFAEDVIPSDAFLFDELQFNMEDFVTVDEVNDDADRSPQPHHSSSSSRRRERREERKDYKISSTSSSLSSSKPTKSISKPSSSTSASKAASSSPPESTETPSSPSKSGASSSPPSGEKANTKSAEERLSEGAVPMSDHRVSAESPAPKTVESETKMEARREMQPPQQRKGSDLNQTQDLEMDLEVRTNKKLKKDKEDDNKTEVDTTLDQMEDGGPGSQPAGSDGGLEVDPEEFVEMEVLDSVREDQEDGLVSKQLSEEDADPKMGKSEDKSTEETNTAEELDKSGEQAPKNTEQKGREVKVTETVQDQLLQEGGSKDDLKDPDSDVTEQAFEILDSINDQNDEGLKPKPIEGEEDDTYQVIDSVEDQPTTSESETGNRQRRSRRRNATAKQDDRPSRRSDPTSKALKSAEKQEQTEATTAAREENVFEIVDSVEEDATARERSGRRRSTRGKKVSEKPEEVTYAVLDSVETANDEPAITTRSTRARRGRTSGDTKSEETPTRRRQTPARESRSREKTPKTEEKAPLPTKTDAEAATFEILDSVECVQEDPPGTRGKGKRGRPKKQTKATKNGNTAGEKGADEGNATYRVLDSVEDEFTDDQSVKEQAESEKEEKNSDEEQKSEPPAEEAEEETVFQVLDCLEDEQVQDEPATTEVEKTEAEEDKQTGFSTVSEVSEQLEESLPQKDEGNDSSLPDGSASGNTEQTSASPNRSQSVTVTLEREKSPETQSPLVNLEKVSDEEEDYPDDTAEEEELRKRQAAAKRKQLTKVQRARRARTREERGETRRTVEVDSAELVTVDEVGADEAEDEMAQTLVTLDEFVEEEEEQRDVKSGTLGQEDRSLDDLNHETLVTLDEADFDEEEKQTRSAKRKHDDDTEESVNFVIVDELKDEENREPTPRTRGRPKKKPRQTPVRKSTRGKTDSRIDEAEEEEERGPTGELASDNDPLKLSRDHQEVQDTVSQADVDSSTAEPELGNRTQEVREKEGDSRMDVKVESKQRREPLGPETKRSRSQSPSVPHDFLLPDFKPNNPLGKEFVVPGFFCNLCCVFYPNESTAKELHCSSQTHYNNLRKHYRRLQQKSRSSAQSCRESTSAGF